MSKKSRPFIVAAVVLLAAAAWLYTKYLRQTECPVFIESFDHGVMTADREASSGDDGKFRVVCKKGDTITVNINPERTDKKYYDLKKLTVNGVDVTDDVSMLQYKLKVKGKTEILAYFKKGKRPSENDGAIAEKLPNMPEIANPFDNAYLGSCDAYNVKDPSVIYDSVSGYYYCFATGNAVMRSKDLINWDNRTGYFASPENSPSEAVMDFGAFPSVKKWAKEHGYDSDPALSTNRNDRTPTAPDIVKFGSEYYLYYSLSKSENANESAIFCVKTNDLAYSVESKNWTDVGLVVSTCGYNAGEDENHPNRSSYDGSMAVHPSVIFHEGKLYMVYGSYFGKDKISGGIYMLELDPNTGLLLKKSKLNAEGEEISTLHGKARYHTGRLLARPGRVPALGKKEGSLVTAADIIYNADTKYFYLFVTYGDEQTNYNIRVSRSKKIGGPYTDFAGEKMNEFASSKKENQYTKGFKLIGGYNFEKSSAGGASYTDIGKASTGSPCIFQTAGGEWIMASQSRVFYKAEDDIVTGDDAAKLNELSVKTAPALETRQILFAGNDWPCALPEAYAGEKLSGGVMNSDMQGNWDVIVFDNSGSAEDYQAVERSVSKSVSILGNAVISQSDIEKHARLKPDTLKKANKKAYSIMLDGVEYVVYPTVAWDWELEEGTLTFTGTGSDGSTVWGKKNYSSDAGIYSDAFYYLLSFAKKDVREKYEQQIQKISNNPSQAEIDRMTNELIEILLKDMK